MTRLIAVTASLLGGVVALSATAPISSASMSRAQAAATECADLVDNNGNGLVDMADPYCRAPDDNSESSFGSAVPGDDTNAPSALDCWFDFNSGTGDDGCDRHACCGIPGTCPADLEPDLYDAGACAQSETCLGNCVPITRVDCDCFGCCDVCIPGTSTCRVVYVHPVISPGCTIGTITDPGICRPCQRDPSCVGPIAHLFSDGFETSNFSRWNLTSGSLP